MFTRLYVIVHFDTTRLRPAEARARNISDFMNCTVEPQWNEHLMPPLSKTQVSESPSADGVWNLIATGNVDDLKYRDGRFRLIHVGLGRRSVSQIERLGRSIRIGNGRGLVAATLSRHDEFGCLAVG